MRVDRLSADLQQLTAVSRDWTRDRFPSTLFHSGYCILKKSQAGLLTA
ncbi:MAG: hypothetical protein ACM37W_22605 [Actinomycetota bacterium]